MTKANWRALIDAMRNAGEGSFTLTGPETAAVLHELEALGPEFLTVTEPPPKALERAT
jgi:hypothetical protein